MAKVGDGMYLCIDMQSFFASVECSLRGLNPKEVALAVVDDRRGDGALVMAASPKLKEYGVKSRCRLYEIDKNNLVDAGIEFGLPMYNSKGDQPYRIDWQHPTSVEDKGGFGDAYHLGLNANWSTAITDSVMFSLGVTYDYYNARKADATTYINQSYYTNMVTSLQNAITYIQANPSQFVSPAATLAAYQTSLTEAQEIVDYYNGQGWKIESKDEIKSVYSSMGIRMGVSVKF